jgi:hypothetical protein
MAAAERFFAPPVDAPPPLLQNGALPSILEHRKGPTAP